MAFYIYEQPAFLEHFHPRIYQPVRSVSRHWDLLENLFDQEEMARQSSQNHCSSRSEKKSLEKSTNSATNEGKMDVEIENFNKENKTVEPVTKIVSKRFMFQVASQETMDKVEVKIQFSGHKFKVENLDVQIINDNVLVVKAEDDEEKFEKKFKLPSNILVAKIETKFDAKENDVQSLTINIPKDVKVFQVPIIAMDE